MGVPEVRCVGVVVLPQAVDSSFTVRSAGYESDCFYMAVGLIELILPYFNQLVDVRSLSPFG